MMSMDNQVAKEGEEIFRFGHIPWRELLLQEPCPQESRNESMMLPCSKIFALAQMALKERGVFAKVMTKADQSGSRR